MLSFANLSDASDLAKMANSIWHEYFPPIIGLGATEHILMNYQTERKIAEQMNDGYQYGYIYDGDRKIGYFAIRDEGEDLFISKLYLYAEERGKGFGNATLNEIMSVAKDSGMKRVYLHVNVNNEKAMKAYERVGMKRGEHTVTEIGDGYVFDDYTYELFF